MDTSTCILSMCILLEDYQFKSSVNSCIFPAGSSAHIIGFLKLECSSLCYIGLSTALHSQAFNVSLLKVAPSQPLVSDANGHKDQRDRGKDDSFATVRDRKVRICEGSSLYALCRSWLRNGFPEESQAQFVDGAKSLPKPSSTPVADTPFPPKKEGDKEEEEEEEKSVDNLSPKDLLQRHVKRAKRVRARLSEERLQRIARYKTRLALLLPPLSEQQRLTNDTAASH
ncbi:uncharacterized protein LOC130774506 [Actinidia eriantha]|uniref:uncharacterized protein LOC130774506 n=1 Tax=Actinidia eriantha TaxID=165200 RepID=UPI00258E1ECF|nr:uncharacterized protein LOC130774506 [Actinidia eriantha]